MKYARETRAIREARCNGFGREQKFYSLPISNKNRFHVSSKGPSSGISVGGRGKHACFLQVNILKQHVTNKNQSDGFDQNKE